VDWTDEKPPSAVETIDWIPPYEGEIPDTDELNDWVKEGEVCWSRRDDIAQPDGRLDVETSR